MLYFFKYLNKCHFSWNIYIQFCSTETSRHSFRTKRQHQTISYTFFSHIQSLWCSFIWTLGVPNIEHHSSEVNNCRQWNPLKIYTYLHIRILKSLTCNESIEPPLRFSLKFSLGVPNWYGFYWWITLNITNYETFDTINFNIHYRMQFQFKPLDLYLGPN